MQRQSSVLFLGRGRRWRRGERIKGLLDGMPLKDNDLLLDYEKKGGAWKMSTWSESEIAEVFNA